MLSSMSNITNAVRPLLEIFATDLRDVRFGELDATTLATVAAQVDAAADAVASAQLAVEGARARLQEREETLLQQAQRALAYARVYADANPELGPRLDAIALPRPVRRARPDTDEQLVLSSEPLAPRRPRGRPRRIAAGEAVHVANEATAE